MLVAIAALLLAWILYSLILGPLYRTWTRLDKDIEISKIELKKAVKILKQKETVIKEYNTYLGKFSVKQSDEEEMASMLNEIETQARLASVKLVNMKPRRVEKGDFYRFFYVDLDTEANMQNILKFIKALKDSKYAMCVEQLTLNSRSGEPTILNSTITVSRFGISPKD